LFVDEVLAVGDAAFQKKCLGKMSDVAREGKTVLFVSHNMNAIQRLCAKSVLLEDGRLVAHDETTKIVARYLANSTIETTPETWIDVAGIKRDGTKQINVTRIWYSGCDAATQFYPYSNGPLEVQLMLTSDVPRQVGSLAITLYDKNGTKLVNADTMTLGRSVNLRSGSNLVRLRIDALHLNPGMYSLGWWIADPIGRVFDFADAAIKIEVVGRQAAGLGITPQSDGVVTCSFNVIDVVHG
jgi:hypothetical protein